MKFTREIEVDLWKTGAHSIEIGLKKEDQFRAKSRQFTKDSDIIGEISEKGDTVGYIVYREDPWKAPTLERRIVIKSFTKSMGWKGSMEELVARGIAQTAAGGKSLPSFIINLGRTDLLIPFEKVHRHGSMGKSVFSFILIDSETNQVFPFRIEADRFTLGSDWDVFDYYDNKIAKIDGSKFNVGGKWKIQIDENAETYRKEVKDILILFSALNRFLEDTEKKLEESLKILRKEKQPIEIERTETLLYQNPRLIKM